MLHSNLNSIHAYALNFPARYTLKYANQYNRMQLTFFFYIMSELQDRRSIFNLHHLFPYSVSDS